MKARFSSDPLNYHGPLRLGIAFPFMKQVFVRPKRNSNNSKAPPFAVSYFSTEIPRLPGPREGRHPPSDHAGRERLALPKGGGGGTAHQVGIKRQGEMKQFIWELLVAFFSFTVPDSDPRRSPPPAAGPAGGARAGGGNNFQTLFL